MSKFDEKFQSCRRAAVPLVVIETSDPSSSLTKLRRALNGKGDVPIVRWDIVRSAVPINTQGRDWVTAVCGDDDPKIKLSNPVEMLASAESLPDKAVLVMLGVARIMEEAGGGAAIVQGIWNLRDVLKLNGATLVMTVPLGWKVPADLVNDIVVVEDPLPTRDELTIIIRKTMSTAGLALSEEVGIKASAAVSGLNEYAAENCVAMNVTKEGLNLDGLWDTKRKVISQVPGLSVYRGNETRADVFGYDAIVDDLLDFAGADDSFQVIALYDEIEKHLAGNAGDLSGVTQNMTAEFCTSWEELQIKGIQLYGVAGTGKSTLAKILSGVTGRPLVFFNFDGMKSSLVGQSGERLRTGFATLAAMGGVNGILAISTCNGVSSLSPEVAARLGGFGKYFLDLPSDEELVNGIFPLWMRKLGLPEQEVPKCSGWTGREVRDCCRNAKVKRVSLLRAAEQIVPISVAKSEIIEQQRRQAHGKFLSATYRGLYKYEPQVVNVAGVRRLEVGV